MAEDTGEKTMKKIGGTSIFSILCNVAKRVSYFKNIISIQNDSLDTFSFNIFMLYIPLNKYVIYNHISIYFEI